MIRIDKSLFSDKEREQYEALIAKATVDPEANPDNEGEDNNDGEGGETPPPPPVAQKKKTAASNEVAAAEALGEEPAQKSAGISPELLSLQKRYEALEKSIKMKEFTDVAKKYETLGENTEELAKTLYAMHESNEANYNAYINLLDKSLGLVNKGGLFSEIGKSYHGAAGGSVIDQINAAATEIQKSDTSLTREQAVDKAWETHPELVAEYDSAYRKG